LTNYFSVHGLIDNLISDNASNFKGQKITNFLKKLNVNVLNSSPRRSVSKGLVERICKEANSIIRNNRENENIDIFHIISSVGAIINHFPLNNSILTPYNLHFFSVKGIERNLTAASKSLIPEFIFDSESLEKRFENKCEILHQIIDNTKKLIIEKKTKILAKQNLSRKSIQHYKHNDLVLVKQLNSNELGYKYREIFPFDVYRVTQVRKHILYLENLVSSQIIFRHPSQCKKLNLEKIGNLKLPESVIKAFNLINIKDLSNINIPVLNANRRVLNKDLTLEETIENYDELNDLDSQFGSPFLDPIEE